MHSPKGHLPILRSMGGALFFLAHSNEIWYPTGQFFLSAPVLPA
jgi:hypothetical protein